MGLATGPPHPGFALPRDRKKKSSSQLVRQQGGILGRPCGEGNVVATRARLLLFTGLYKSRYTRSARWSESSCRPA